MLSEYGVLNIWTYVAGTIFIILLPGPNSLYVLATGAGRGVKAGFQAAGGVFLGDSILMTLIAAGAASVLQLLPMLFYSLKAIGAIYLSYLGIRLLLSALKPEQHQEHKISSKTGGYFRKALTLSLLNPKAILFLLSFFVQFVDPSYDKPAISFLILALILQFFSMCYLTALIYSGDRLAAVFRKHTNIARIGSAMVGSLFLYFAAKMAVE